MILFKCIQRHIQNKYTSSLETCCLKREWQNFSNCYTTLQQTTFTLLISVAINFSVKIIGFLTSSPLRIFVRNCSRREDGIDTDKNYLDTVLLKTLLLVPFFWKKKTLKTKFYFNIKLSSKINFQGKEL